MYSASKRPHARLRGSTACNFSRPRLQRWIFLRLLRLGNLILIINAMTNSDMHIYRWQSGVCCILVSSESSCLLTLSLSLSRIHSLFTPFYSFNYIFKKLRSRAMITSILRQICVSLVPDLTSVAKPGPPSSWSVLTFCPQWKNTREHKMSQTPLED